MRRKAIDTLILGCTHYPLLTGVISYVMGDGVTLVSSAEETAKDVYRLLVEHRLARPDDLAAPRHRFLTTGDPQEFAALARRFLGPEVVTASSAAAEVRRAVRLTVVGCSGSFPGPGLGRVLLPGRGPGDDGSGAPAPGGSCSTSAAARSARSSATPRCTRSTPSCSATCTRTTAWTSPGCTSR